MSRLAARVIFCLFALLPTLPSFSQSEPLPFEGADIATPLLIIKTAPLSPALGLLTPSANFAVEYYLHPKHSLQAEVGYLYSYKLDNGRVLGQNGYRFRAEYLFHPFSPSMSNQGLYLGFMASFKNRFVDRLDWVERQEGAYTQLLSYQKQMRYWGAHFSIGSTRFVGKNERLTINIGGYFGVNKKNRHQPPPPR